MSKKQKLNYERNPWKMVIYIIAVVLLAGCLALFLYMRRQQQKTYQEELRQLQSQETEYIRPARVRETETESEAEEEKETEKPAAGKKTAEAALETKQKETGKKADETERRPESEAETESETETESESEAGGLSVAERNAHVLLLNASGKAGVAGAWKKELTKDGYKNVSTASYIGSAKEQTQIYLKKSQRKLAEHLQELFENAEVGFDTFAEDFEMSGGADKPEDVDVYVLIGRENILEE